MAGNAGLDTQGLLEELAEQIATLVVAKLRAADMPGWVDQASSPLGRRRHINAVRSGKLPGVRVGRRYLARQEDVARFVAGATAVGTGAALSELDLAAELGLRRTG